MIDFEALVLGPALAVFGRPVTVTPTASQPGRPAYAARGVFAFKAVEIPLEEGGFHSTNQPSLGIKLGDYPVAPKQGDFIVLGGTSYTIVDIVPDGQGGADIALRVATAP